MVVGSMRREDVKESVKESVASIMGAAYAASAFGSYVYEHKLASVNYSINSDKLITAIYAKPRYVFDVSLSSSYSSSSPYVDVDFRFTKARAQICAPPDIKGAIYVITSQRYVYEAPPASVRSLLFFISNIEVWNSVVKFAENKAPERLLEKIKNVDTIIKSIPSRASSIPKSYYSPEYPIAVSGGFEIDVPSRSRLYLRVARFVIFDYRFGDRLDRLRIEFLDKDSEVVSYEIKNNHFRSLLFLLSNVLSRKEIEQVSKVATIIEKSIARTYIAAMTMKQLGIL